MQNLHNRSDTMVEEQRFLSKELHEEAVGMVRNGDDVDPKRADRIILAIAMDNRDDMLGMDKRLKTIEEHPFHKLTPKRLVSFIVGAITISAVYIKESRDFVVDHIGDLLAVLF